jgi:hypothetical protein
VAHSAVFASAATFSSAATSATSLSVATLSAATASSATFTTASAASLSAVSLKAATASFVAPNVLGAAAGDAAANEPGSGVETAVRAYHPVDGGPPMRRLLLWSNLLYGGWSSSDDTSSSLRTGIADLPFLLLVSGPVLSTPGPPATSIPGICTSRDSSPFCHAAILISSKVGSSCSSLLLVSWPEHNEVQPGGGVVKPEEDGSRLTFNSRVLRTSGAKLDP